MDDTVSLSNDSREESRTAVSERSLTAAAGAQPARFRLRGRRSLFRLTESHLNRLVGARGVDVGQGQFVPRCS